MNKVAFHTLGCKLNFAETSTIGRQFLDNGFEVVGIDQYADVVVLNTCSVTERAERECRQIVRRILRHSPDAYIIIAGCYAQLQPEAIAAINGVDLVIGSEEKFNIFKYAGEFKKKSIPDVFVSCVDELHDAVPAFSSEVGGRTRAFLKIQDGCDYTCAFCTIPLARGESRSILAKDIVHQARRIAAQGHKEIVLTGVNIGDYGRTVGSNLLELMHELDSVDGVERFRISSIEPNLLPQELINFILESEKFCNHFHIPLQSGSDTILRKMRRRYLSYDFRNVVEYIKLKDPNAAIGADVIVGFPGESDEMFNETYNFLVELPISYLHVFTYSERPKTAAVKLPDTVQPRIRHERNEILRRLGEKKKYDFYSLFVGMSLPVLFEGTLHNDRISGLTSNYIRVETNGDRSLINQIKNVKITTVQKNICLGERISHISQMLSVNKSDEVLIST